METTIIITIFAFILILLTLRAIGAWMFRIDEVIKELKKQNEILIHMAREQGLELKEK